MKKSAAIVSTAIACVGMLLTGCQKSSNSGTQNQSKITVVENTPVDSLDPAVAYQESAIVTVANTTEGLYTMDAHDKPQFGLASEVKTSNHGLTKTFTIREDAKWSNGDPVTANDFVFGWRRFSDPKNASPYNFELGAAGIKNADAITLGKKPTSALGVRATGPKTLVVELDHPVPFLSRILAFAPFAPVNQKYFEKTGKKFGQDSSHVIATGPYKIKDWKLGDNTVQLVKNPKYWDAKNVKVKEIKLDVITDPEKAAIAFENGNADYVRLSGQLVSKYHKDKNFVDEISNFNHYLIFNMKEPGINNANLRKAISVSLNRKEITTHILKDGSVPVHSMVMRKLGKNPKTGKDFADESTTNLSQYSPADAKKYWNKAKSETKLRSFTLLYDDSDPSYSNVAAYIKAQVEKNLPGMKVNLQQVSKKTRLDKMAKSNFDAGISRWAPDYGDISAVLNMYVTGNASNYAKWSDPEYDRLIAQANKETDLSKRYQLLLKANNILVDSAACPPLYQAGAPVLRRTNIKDMTMHISGVPLVFKYVYIK